MASRRSTRRSMVVRLSPLRDYPPRSEAAALIEISSDEELDPTVVTSAPLAQLFQSAISPIRTRARSRQPSPGTESQARPLVAPISLIPRRRSVSVQRDGSVEPAAQVVKRGRGRPARVRPAVETIVETSGDDEEVAAAVASGQRPATPVQRLMQTLRRSLSRSTPPNNSVEDDPSSQYSQSSSLSPLHTDSSRGTTASTMSTISAASTDSSASAPSFPSNYSDPSAALTPHNSQDLTREHSQPPTPTPTSRLSSSSSSSSSRLANVGRGSTLANTSASADADTSLSYSAPLSTPFHSDSGESFSTASAARARDISTAPMCSSNSGSGSSSSASLPPYSQLPTISISRPSTTMTSSALPSPTTQLSQSRTDGNTGTTTTVEDYSHSDDATSADCTDLRLNTSSSLGATINVTHTRTDGNSATTTTAEDFANSDEEAGPDGQLPNDGADVQVSRRSVPKSASAPESFVPAPEREALLPTRPVSSPTVVYREVRRGARVEEERVQGRGAAAPAPAAVGSVDLDAIEPAEAVDSHKKEPPHVRFDVSSADDDRTGPLFQSYGRSNATFQRQRQVGHWEFGGPWLALVWLLLIPYFGLQLLSSCALHQCWRPDWHNLTDSLAALPIAISIPLPDGPWEALLLFTVFVATHYLFAAFDCGAAYSQIVRGRTHVEFVFHRGTILGVHLLAINAGDCLGLGVSMRIWRNFVPLAALFVVYALLVAGACYLRRNFGPPEHSNEWGQSGRCLADCFNGADLHQRWARLIDVKVLHHRMAVHLACLLNVLVLQANLVLFAVEWRTMGLLQWRHWQPLLEQMRWRSDAIGAAGDGVAWQPEADVVSAVIAALVSVNLLRQVYGERRLLTSFELQEEGVGAQLMLRYALQPFAAALMSRLTFERKVVGMPDWALALMAVLYVLGMLVQHVADETKYQYRVRPRRKEFDNCPVVVSTRKAYRYQDFLLFGGWGLVRHPNYLGDLICTLVLLAPLGWRFQPQPLLLALFHCGYMVHRTYRVQRRMEKCYGEDYGTYVRKVRSRLVPWLY